MTVLTKKQALEVIRRAYGSERADELADELPAHIDTEDPADANLLARLGLSRDQLFSRLGGEL